MFNMRFILKQVVLDILQLFPIHHGNAWPRDLVVEPVKLDGESNYF